MGSAFPAAALPIRQIAYFVPDIALAARAHHAAFGSGPFFLSRHVALAANAHRGVERRHDHSSAYGQCGDVMVEFVMQHGDEPSAFTDMFPAGSGQYGMHHTAVWVKDFEAALADFASHKMPLAQRARTASGVDYAFVDARATLGHMIELYEPSEGLVGFYAMVRDAAQGWDGSDVLREPEQETG